MRMMIRGFVVDVASAETGTRVQIADASGVLVDVRKDDWSAEHAEAWAEVAVERLLAPDAARIPEYP